METQLLETPRVLAQQEKIWVLYKPSGFAVHRAADHKIPDLMTWAGDHLPLPGGLAPIHRLDRHTSGLVLCSADPEVRANIGAHFANQTISKEYRALVLGKTHKKGVIRRPLKDKRRRKQLACATRYRRLMMFRKTSYLSISPETGRYHQIRRHFQGIGHAIVGDERYPPRKFQAVPGFPGRLWLHAYRLTLPDETEFICPLPEPLEAHLALLRERLP